MCPNISPLPFCRQGQTRQEPCLDLLPSVLCENCADGTVFLLDLIESITPSFNCVAINAQKVEVNHPVVALENFLQTLVFESFGNPLQQRVLTHLDFRPWLSEFFKQPAKQRC